jgi:hypothetical protein
MREWQNQAPSLPMSHLFLQMTFVEGSLIKIQLRFIGEIRLFSRELLAAKANELPIKRR